MTMLFESGFICIRDVLTLTSIVFFIGLSGVALNRKNLLVILMSIELLLLSVNLNFAAFSITSDTVTGQIFILFILAIAAAESAIGLSLITVYYASSGKLYIIPFIEEKNQKL